MCTVLLLSHPTSPLPLRVAANRDEALDRPAESPKIRSDWAIPALAPLDLRAGGTWLGLNQHGVFAAITNRFGTPPDPLRRSRGQLVRRALTAISASEGATRVASLPAANYNPFHLAIGDRDGLWLVWSDGSQLHCEPLPAGNHVLTERSLGAAPSGRQARLEREVTNWSPQTHNDTLRQALAHHEDQSFDGTCVHLPESQYGTRSSTLFTLGRRPHESRLWHAAGPPCQTPWQDLSASAQSLLLRGVT